MTLSKNNVNDDKPLNKKRVCPKCKIELGTRVSRGVIVKTFFSWLPVKRYMCYRCQRKRYLWV